MTNEMIENGTAITVGGAIVAWFMDGEAAIEWASENHFGNWLSREAAAPKIIPFTAEYLAECRRKAEEMYAKICHKPEAE